MSQPPLLTEAVAGSTSGILATLPLAQNTSVIVVAYNAGPVLRDCVASILSTEPDVQVIIVDNASSDGALDRVAAEFPSIEIVTNTINTGFGSGNNLGVAHAKNKYLVFLNPDVVVNDGWLEVLTRPLVEDNSAGLVTPKVLLRHEPDRINVAGLNVHLSGISICRGLGSLRSDYTQPAEVASISGVAFATRREVFEAIDGFDGDFFLYMEDVDISLRTWLAGYRCLYVPQAAVLHDYDRVKVDTRKTFWVERGRYLMLLKAFRWLTLLALLPTLLLAEVVTWGWIMWRNPIAVTQKLRAWGWILAHWRQIAKKRRHVQAHRTVSDEVFLKQCRWEIDFGQLSGPRVAHATKVLFNPLLWSAAAVLRLVIPHCAPARRGV